MIDFLKNTFIESVQNTNENYNKHFHNTYKHLFSDIQQFFHI